MARRFVELPADASPVDSLAAILPTDDDVATSWRVWLSVRAAALADPDLAAFHRRMYDEWDEALTYRLRPLVGDHADDADGGWAVDHVMAIIDGIALRATLDRDAWPAERQRSHLTAALTTVADTLLTEDLVRHRRLPRVEDHVLKSPGG